MSQQHQPQGDMGVARPRDIGLPLVLAPELLQYRPKLEALLHDLASNHLNAEGLPQAMAHAIDEVATHCCRLLIS